MLSLAHEKCRQCSPSVAWAVEGGEEGPGQGLSPVRHNPLLFLLCSSSPLSEPKHFYPKHLGSTSCGSAGSVDAVLQNLPEEKGLKSQPGKRKALRAGVGKLLSEPDRTCLGSAGSHSRCPVFTCGSKEDVGNTHMKGCGWAPARALLMGDTIWISYPSRVL